MPDFEKRWNQYARAVGDSWRVDETYIKVKGQWVYLYRAVDKQGRTVDFLLSQRRDVATAKRFFSHATRQHGAPRVITLDGYAASHRAVAQLKEVGTLPRRVRIRSSQYLNNVVEQDHRRIKQRIRPMLGFKRFETAAVTIRGIELVEKIKKNQFNLRPLTKKKVIVPAPLGGDLGGIEPRKSFCQTNIHLSGIAPEPCRCTEITLLGDCAVKPKGIYIAYYPISFS